MQEFLCTKCGSREVIPDVRIIDHGHGNAALNLSATVYSNPDAWIFKGTISHRFIAQVCADCGFTEFYVENPRELRAAAENARRHDS